MKPSEFTAFDEQWPEGNKWLIVTNNISATNTHGEMSHVWLTTFFTVSSDDANELITFDAGDLKIRGLTHWKYA